MVGKILYDQGKIFENNELEVKHKIFEKGTIIPDLNYQGKMAFFTMIKGKAKIVFKDDEEHILEPGEVLYFDGDNHYSAEALDDTQVFVFLSQKEN